MPLPTHAAARSLDSTVTLLFLASSPPPRPGGGAAARARARPRPLAAARGEEEGRSGPGGQGGARRGTADVGLALSRSLPGGRTGTRTRGRARGRPGGGSSRRRWLHFPGLRGGHSGSRGQQPREPELERPGAAAAAARRDLKCPPRHKELMTVQVLVEEVLMETNVKVFSKNQKESKFSPRKRREKYPAKQLLNCQLVLKEFRRNLQKLRWTLLPTVAASRYSIQSRAA
ncbi:uncharacterized protein [Equus przewalskii]|uniref:Uncharacterized protein isoform X1 n=1 Tax=Equus przewalskii TaxID=9798 RepID=A0ABM4KZG6_EQUPR